MLSYRVSRASIADFGFDPLGLGANPERLAWFAESERVHCRWAMLGVAGILVQVRWLAVGPAAPAACVVGGVQRRSTARGAAWGARFRAAAALRRRGCAEKTRLRSEQTALRGEPRPCSGLPAAACRRCQ